MRKNKQQCDGLKKNCLTKTSAKTRSVELVKRNVTLDFFLCRLIEDRAKIAKHVVCYSNNLHILLVQRVYLRKQHRAGALFSFSFSLSLSLPTKHTNTTVNRNPMSAQEFVNDRDWDWERERGREKEKKVGVEFYLTRTRRAQNAQLYGRKEGEGRGTEVESIEVKSKWRRQHIRGKSRPTVCSVLGQLPAIIFMRRRSSISCSRIY